WPARAAGPSRSQPLPGSFGFVGFGVVFEVVRRGAAFGFDAFTAAGRSCGPFSAAAGGFVVDLPFRAVEARAGRFDTPGPPVSSTGPEDTPLPPEGAETAGSRSSTSPPPPACCGGGAGRRSSSSPRRSWIAAR